MCSFTYSFRGGQFKKNKPTVMLIKVKKVYFREDFLNIRLPVIKNSYYKIDVKKIF